MQVKQCRNCGKLFNSLGRSVCLECEEELDRQFRRVRDYLYDHPNADIAQIVKQTEIPERTILQFLREERLSLQGGSADGALVCEQCGKPIPSGKICVACRERLSSLLESKLESWTPAKAQQTPGPAKQGRKHFENNTW